MPVGFTKGGGGEGLFKLRFDWYIKSLENLRIARIADFPKRLPFNLIPGSEKY